MIRRFAAPQPYALVAARQEVTDAMVERARAAWVGADHSEAWTKDYLALVRMRAALTAALKENDK
jgi:hypothetical protein